MSGDDHVDDPEQSRSALLEIPEIRAEVESLGLPYRFEILQRRRRSPKRGDATALEGLGAGPVLELLCRHWAGERPFCLEERLINLAETPEAEAEAFEVLSPGAWLLSRAPCIVPASLSPRSGSGSGSVK